MAQVFRGLPSPREAQSHSHGVGEQKAMGEKPASPQLAGRSGPAEASNKSHRCQGERGVQTEASAAQLPAFILYPDDSGRSLGTPMASQGLGARRTVSDRPLAEEDGYSLRQEPLNVPVGPSSFHSVSWVPHLGAPTLHSSLHPNLASPSPSFSVQGAEDRISQRPLQQGFSRCMVGSAHQSVLG